MKYYTLDAIMELRPCYDRKELEVYMEGRKRISLSGILSSKASDADKIWLVTQLIPTDKVAEFAKWCADSVSHIDNTWANAAAAAAAWAAGGCAADYAADYAADAASYATVAHRGTVPRAAAYKNQVNQLKIIVKENKL